MGVSGWWGVQALSSWRWTSCREENILSWIRGMFVYQDGCAAPGQREGEY